MSNENEHSAIHFENLCDLILITGNDNNRFHVHRNVMASANNYFSAPLGSSSKEADKKEIVLKNIDGATLKLLIEFSYTGHIGITDDNVDIILAAASSIEFYQIVQKCCEYLEKNMTIENCVQNLLRPDKYSFKYLHGKIFDFIAEHFSQVSVKLKLLDEKCALKLFNSDKINAIEEEVFYAVRDWIENNEIKCSELITNLFNCVRLEHIPVEFLTTSIEDFSKLHNCQKFVLDECKRRVFSQKTTRPNRDRTFANCDIFCYYTQHSNLQTIVHLKMYDIVMNRWEHYKTFMLNSVVEHPDIVFWENKMYVIGGGCNDSNYALRSMTSFDLSSLEQTNLSKMQYERIGASSLVLDGKIYVIGGGDGYSCTNFCERFDTKLKVWENIDPMRTERADHAVAQMNGNIYAAGGMGMDIKNLSTVECYSSKTNKWNFIAEMHRPRFNFGLSALNGFLYAMGWDCIVERYDPIIDVWTTIGLFKETRYVTSIFGGKGGIFALSKNGKFNKYSSTMDNCISLNRFKSCNYTDGSQKIFLMVKKTEIKIDNS